MAELVIRPSRDQDVAAVDAILTHHVLHTLSTMELVPPGVEETARRRADILARGMPHLVAELDGALIGYAHASPYRLRAGFASTVEDTIYLAPGHVGRGHGRRLLAALIEACTAADFRQMVAVIGNADNAASVALHQTLGFVQVGLLPRIGHKFGAWRDCLLMQRALGAGDGTLPTK